MQIWRLLISIWIQFHQPKKWTPLRESSDPATFQSCRPKTREMTQTFGKLENKRQTYGSQAWVDWPPYICLIFGFFKCLPFCVYLAYSSETWLCYYFWHALSRDGVQSFGCSNQFMLITSLHICIRSIVCFAQVDKPNLTERRTKLKKAKCKQSNGDFFCPFIRQMK